MLHAVGRERRDACRRRAERAASGSPPAPGGAGGSRRSRGSLRARARGRAAAPPAGREGCPTRAWAPDAPLSSWPRREGTAFSSLRLGHERPDQRCLLRVGAEVRGADHRPGADLELVEAGGDEGGDPAFGASRGRSSGTRAGSRETTARRTPARRASPCCRSRRTGRRGGGCCGDGSRRGSGSSGRRRARSSSSRASGTSSLPSPPSRSPLSIHRGRGRRSSGTARRPDATAGGRHRPRSRRLRPPAAAERSSPRHRALFEQRASRRIAAEQANRAVAGPERERLGLVQRLVVAAPRDLQHRLGADRRDVRVARERERLAELDAPVGRDRLRQSTSAAPRSGSSSIGER